MKKFYFFILISLCFALNSCESETDIENLNTKVLVLKVDYQTNKFEGGTELTFNKETTGFTLKPLYTSPADFGNISIYYEEIGTKIFDGGIVWNGSGKINFPIDFKSASTFTITGLKNIVYPVNGFDNIFQQDYKLIDYNPIWLSVQNLEKVRLYLADNPNAKVKLFLYTPSVGFGNPAEWKWIIFMNS